MGAEIVNSNELLAYEIDLNNYAQMNSLLPLKIWRHRFSEDQLMEYPQRVLNTPELLAKFETFKFRYKHEYFVSSLFAQVDKQEHCGEEHILRVFYERVLTNFSKIKHIPFNDSLHCYQTAIMGFQLLYQKFGYFEIFEEMFHLCHGSKMKVWCNKAIYAHAPQAYLRNPYGLQQDMVTKIISILDQNVDHSDQPFSIKAYLISNNYRTFSSAIASFKKMCRDSKLCPNDRLESMASAESESIENLLDIYALKLNKYKTIETNSASSRFNVGIEPPQTDKVKLERPSSVREIKPERKQEQRPVSTTKLESPSLPRETPAQDKIFFAKDRVYFQQGIPISPMPVVQTLLQSKPERETLLRKKIMTPINFEKRVYQGQPNNRIVSEPHPVIKFTQQAPRQSQQTIQRFVQPHCQTAPQYLKQTGSQANFTPNRFIPQLPMQIIPHDPVQIDLRHQPLQVVDSLYQYTPVRSSSVSNSPVNQQNRYVRFQSPSPQRGGTISQVITVAPQRKMEVLRPAHRNNQEGKFLQTDTSNQSFNVSNILPVSNSQEEFASKINTIHSMNSYSSLHHPSDHSNVLSTRPINPISARDSQTVSSHKQDNKQQTTELPNIPPHEGKSQFEERRIEAVVDSPPTNEISAKRSAPFGSYDFSLGSSQDSLYLKMKMSRNSDSKSKITNKAYTQQSRFSKAEDALRRTAQFARYSPTSSPPENHSATPTYQLPYYNFQRPDHRTDSSLANTLQYSSTDLSKFQFFQENMSSLSHNETGQNVTRSYESDDRRSRFFRPEVKTLFEPIFERSQEQSSSLVSREQSRYRPNIDPQLLEDLRQMRQESGKGI